jgi:hypothetical protein
MGEVVNMSKIRFVLVNGEKDGYERELSPDQIPQIFYAVPNLDETKIANTKNNDAKRELRDKLAVLAYRYDALSSTPDCFRMIRTPELDKQASAAE